MKLRVLDLFSGIGGFSLGLERTGGFETIAFCEQDEFCQKVLRKHWPDVPIHDDVRKLDGRTISADVICGGFPCQDISIANQSAEGIDGERSGLWKEYKRIIAEVGCSYAIIENVRALLHRGLVTVLRDLSEIGFDAEWHVISASSIGSIQARPRVWIIAYPSGQRVQGLLEGVNLGEFRQRRACSQKDLQYVYDKPFDGTRWAQPLLCGRNERVPGWVDRIKSLGNTVDPSIPELIGNQILRASA